MLTSLVALLAVTLGPGIEGGTTGALVKANNRSAFELFGKVRRRPVNVVISPYSISTALAMAHAGAAGRTADEMAGRIAGQRD